MVKDYSKGKIYTVRSRSCELVYIGSTIQTLPDRLSGHYRHLKSYKNGKGDKCSSYQILEKGDAYIELFEYYPCDTEQELRRYEGQCQRNYECVNLQIAGRTKAEYREDKKEQIFEYQKKYKQENKEQILERAKKYYQENKERINEKDKKYHQKNKEQISEKKKVKITCEVCGLTVSKSGVARHRRSKKHLANC